MEGRVNVGQFKFDVVMTIIFNAELIDAWGFGMRHRSYGVLKKIIKKMKQEGQGYTAEKFETLANRVRTYQLQYRAWIAFFTNEREKGRKAAVKEFNIKMQKSRSVTAKKKKKKKKTTKK